MTAATAVGVFRTPALLNIVARGGFISLGVSLAAMIGTGMVARSIPYEEGLGKKQLAWALHVSNILLQISYASITASFKTSISLMYKFYLID